MKKKRLHSEKKLSNQINRFAEKTAFQETKTTTPKESTRTHADQIQSECNFRFLVSFVRSRFMM